MATSGPTPSKHYPTKPTSPAQTQPVGSDETLDMTYDHEHGNQSDLTSDVALDPFATQSFYVAEQAVEANLAKPAFSNGSPRKYSDSVQAGSRTIGPYRLLRRLGAGGMGEVWEAEQSEPIVRRVALKLVKAGEETREIIGRFAAERQALAWMEHRNIARLIDAGSTETGALFFVMELVAGEPITHYCDRHQLGIKERLELFLQICAGVEHAHQKGIIHRDLKPGNILVGQEDQQPVPKVIDFGLAKATEVLRIRPHSDDTAAGQILGTPRYMSPEQARSSQDIDVRTDVYALGVILHELLVGFSPLADEQWQGKSVWEILELIQRHEPMRPSVRLARAAGAEGHEGPNRMERIAINRGTSVGQLQRILCGELDWVITKVLANSREERYPAVSALADEIRRYLGGEPIKARPPTAGYHFKKFVFRHRWAVATAVSMAIVMVTATAISVLFGLQANAALMRESKSLENERIARQQSQQELTRSRQQRLIAASQRGQWREVVELVDTQLRTTTENPGWWRLQKIQSLHELLRYAEAQREIEIGLSEAADELEGESARGPLLLWQAELVLLSDSTKAREYVSAALAEGLPPADKYYAESLLAPTVKESLELARRAQVEFPFDARFHKQLIIGEFLRGEHAQVQSRCGTALQLFPDDPTIRTINALSFGLMGDDNSLQKILQEDKQMSPASRTLIAVLCRDSRAIGNYLVNFDNQDLPVDIQARLLQAVLALPRESWFAEISARMPVGSLDEVHGVVQETLQVALLGDDTAKRRAGFRAAGVAAAGDNGLLHLLAGYLYYSANLESEAITEFRLASRTNWVIPYPRNDALFMACMTAVGRGLREPTEENREEVRELLNELYGMGIAPHRKLLFAGLAAHFGEPFIALTILNSLEPSERQDPKWLERASKAAVAIGAWELASKYSQELLKNDPQNQRALETQRQVDAAIERLRGKSD